MNPSPPLRYFAGELRRAREAAGLSQEQLGKETNFSKSMVAMIETCQRVPKLDFCQAVDNALGTDGRFARMVGELLLATEVSPEWFRPWVDHEREAAEIRWYEPLLVPGLLQTEAYAGAVLRRDGDPERTDGLVAARMDRQRVLGRAAVLVIVEESVLRRRIGGPDVMHEQLVRLTTAPAGVQVLPAEAETNRHLDGSFALAVIDGTEIAYVDTPARGFVLADREVVSHVRQRWEGLLAEALPRRQSRELILEVAESWKIRSG